MVKEKVKNGEILKSRYENYIKFIGGVIWNYQFHS
jgi:putative ribosome biogenesis GTPase RsgA